MFSETTRPVPRPGRGQGQGESVGPFHLGLSFEEQLCFMNVGFVELIAGIKFLQWMEKAESLTPAGAASSLPPLVPRGCSFPLTPALAGPRGMALYTPKWPFAPQLPCSPSQRQHFGIGDMPEHPSQGTSVALRPPRAFSP